MNPGGDRILIDQDLARLCINYYSTLQDAATVILKPDPDRIRRFLPNKRNEEKVKNDQTKHYH